MQEQRLNIGYTRIPDKIFVPLCQGVIENMTNNPHFPDVGELLTELITTFNEYLAAIPPKNIRNEVNTIAKDVKKDATKSVMRAMGFYVQMIARDDLEKLKTTGYPVAKHRSKANKEMPMPVILAFTTNGTPRQLIVECKAAATADLYDIRVSTDNVSWNGLGNTDTKAKVKVNDLPVDILLYVQARMRNSEHTTPWSASATTRIFDTAVALSVPN